MLQKKASKSIQNSSVSYSGTGRAELKARAANAKALLKSLKTPSLKVLRNRILTEAIKVFSKRKGWIQGTLYGDGSYCAIGGIKKATGRDGIDNRTKPTPEQQAAVDALFASLPTDHRYYPRNMYDMDGAENVVTYNDDDFTTKRKILALFRKAKKQPLKKG